MTLECLIKTISYFELLLKGKQEKQEKETDWEFVSITTVHSITRTNGNSLR